MSSLDDQTTDRLTAAAAALVRGRTSQAAAELRAIDAAALRAEWDAAFARRRALGLKSARAATARKWTTHEQSRPIYERDRYTCRYCGKRTVLVRVLEVLSYAFPEELPYGGRSWPMAHTHIAYWTHTTSLEHLVPHARGGGFDAAENLGVACWQCNHVKGDALIDEVGFQSRTAASDWDGLTHHLPQLVEAAKYHGQAAADWRRWGSKPRPSTPSTVERVKPVPPGVRTRETPTPRAMPGDVHRFLNDESAYQRWLDENPAGFVLAPGSRIRGVSGPAIHHARCTHVNHRDPRWTYTRKIKICSRDRTHLLAISESEFGRPAMFCSSCM